MAARPVLTRGSRVGTRASLRARVVRLVAVQKSTDQLAGEMSRSSSSAAAPMPAPMPTSMGASTKQRACQSFYTALRLIVVFFAAQCSAREILRLLSANDQGKHILISCSLPRDPDRPLPRRGPALRRATVPVESVPGWAQRGLAL